VKRATSLLLAGSLALGVGASVFLAHPAVSNSFSGSEPPAAVTCGEGLDCTSDTFTAADVTGPGFACNSALGSCFDTGPGACNSVGTDGSGNLVLGGTACSPTIEIGGTGNITVTGTTLTIANGGLDMNNNATIVNTGANKPVWVNDTDGLYIQPYSSASLGTCGTIPEGTIRTVLAAGASRTRVCVCTSDGAGSPAFEWRNLQDPSTAGTATTCPATP
jgi:hypothetical protein